MSDKVIVRADGQKWQFQVKGWTIWKLGAFVAEALDEKRTNTQSLQYVLEHIIQRGFPCILTPLDAKGKPEDMREQDVSKNGERLLDMDGDDIAKVIHAFLASKIVSAIFCLTSSERAMELKKTLKQMANALSGMEAENDEQAETTEEPQTSDLAGVGSSVP